MVSRPLTWPESTIQQILAIQALLGDGPRSYSSPTEQETRERFENAPLKVVSRHLETLLMMGEIRIDEGGAYHLVLEAP